MQKVRAARIAGRDFELSASSVAEAVAEVTPEPIRDHYVVVAGRRFPPKQVIATVTGLDRADFTTYQARATLRRLGLTTGRVDRGATTAGPPVAHGEPTWGQAEAAALRPHRGRFVALKGDDVLATGASLAEVFGWLEQHDETADTVFRVPLDPSVDLGGFPG